MLEKETTNNQTKSTSIQIDGAFCCFSELPDDGSISTALVNKTLYFYNSDDASWIRAGEILGPAGPKGDKGEKGDAGKGLKIDGVFTHEEELPEYEKDTMESIIVCERLHVYDTEKQKWIDVGQIRGPKGDKGDVGPKGPIGPPVSVWHGTQKQYDELPVKDEQTFYLITSLF